jgi:polyisoprenoid-binding protein YceI
MKYIVSAAAFALLAACSPPPPAPSAEAPAAETAAQAPSIEGLPAGAYTLDDSHASLVFRVSHLGFSNYTAEFNDLDADLQLDPANPSQATLVARVNPSSLEVNAPPAGFLQDLLGAQWFNVAQFPEITFRSTQIEMTGANTARVRGDLTLHGVTKPIVMDATFNGGWAGIPPDPHARLGFSAHGALNRSEFGMDVGLPPPGSNMGVSDAVEFQIETEFTGPPWTPPADQAPAAP